MKERMAFIAAVASALPLGALFPTSQIHLLLGFPCLIYWIQSKFDSRMLYLGAFAIYFSGEIGQFLRIFLQQKGDVKALLETCLLSLVLWSICIECVCTLLNKTQTIEKSIEDIVNNAATSLQLAEQAASSNQEKFQKVNKALIQWDVLVRNARDGGSNSVLACHVLKKTSDLLTQNSEQVKEMILAANSVQKDTAQLTGISGKIRSISVEAKFLSLNIAVQAARIGESGKAFTFVAEQMKEMTDSTEKLTRLIDRMLTDVSTQTNKSTQLCEKVGKLFKSMKDELEQFRNLMLRIEELSTSQSKHLTTIKATMNERPTVVAKSRLDKRAS